MYCANARTSPSNLVMFLHQSLIITLHNVAWSLGQQELIALHHNELLENRFVRANYFLGKYPLPSVVLCLQSDRGLTANQPAVNETGTKWYLGSIFKSSLSKRGWQPTMSRLFENMILLLIICSWMERHLDDEYRLPEKLLQLGQANKSGWWGWGVGQEWVMNDCVYCIHLD